MKTRGVLVRVPGYPTQLDCLLPDRKLATIAGCLREAGHHVEILDFGTSEFLTNLFPDCLRDSVTTLVSHFDGFPEHNPLSVLHILWTVHSTDKAFRAILARKCVAVAEKIAERDSDYVIFVLNTADDVEPTFRVLRELKDLCPQQHHALAGRYAELYLESLLKANPDISCVFRGDGEASVVLWAERLDAKYDWSEIPNLAYVQNGRIRKTRTEAADLSTLPLPAYDPETYQALADDSAKLRIFEVEESRGCPRLCYACSRTTTERWMRPRPARLVCEEVRRLQGWYGAVAFRFTDITAPGAAHAGNISLALLRQGIAITSSRCLHVCADATEVFQSLFTSGCRVMTFYVDTGSQRLLEDCFGKTTGVTLIETMLHEAKKAGLKTIVRLTYPTPADDYHTREETLRLLSRTKPDYVYVALPEVHPRSVWFAHADRFGYWLSAKFVSEPWVYSRTRFPLPVDRWRNPPYRVGALPASQVVHEQENLISAAHQLGISTQIGDVPVLLAHLSAEEPVTFARRSTEVLYSGDKEIVSSWVAQMNGIVSVPVAAEGFAKRLRPAVGEP